MEKRRNPSKVEKQKGITDPWYIDADPYDPQDKHIFLSVGNRNYEGIPDGEWSAEALGGKIQGNPLDLAVPTVCIFSCGEAPVFKDVPVDYEGLKEWLPKQKSNYGRGQIEGIVWHWEKSGEMFKIKLKDFK